MNKKTIITIIIIVACILFFKDAFIQGLKEGWESSSNTTIENKVELSQENTTIPENVITEPIKNVEKIKLKYGAKEFYEVLCDVAKIEKITPQDLDDELVYENGNMEYSIEIVADKKDNIKSVRLFAFNDDYTNFFNAISRIFETYPEGYDVHTIIHNLGKENKVTFDNIDLEFLVGTSNKPILIVTVN